MKKVFRCVERQKLVRAVHGPNSRFWESRQSSAFAEMRRRGWESGSPEVGMSYEHVAFVRREHPVAATAVAVREGRDVHAVAELETRLGVHPFSQVGTRRLGAAGLALAGADDDSLTLLAADPWLARAVNASRRGAGRKGFNVRQLVRAVLHLSDDRKRLLSSDLRLRAYYVLQQDWAIDCDDLLVPGRERVHLQSCWRVPRR